MSHCAPEATLKPKRFEFTLKTVITDVFVAQVYWEAVPKTVFTGYPQCIGLTGFIGLSGNGLSH